MGGNGSGRSPKPAHLRALHGSRERAHHKRAPKYERQPPVKPALVEDDTIASEKWDDLSERLYSAGVIDASHGEMLAMLCIAWADLDRARAEFRDMNYQMVLGVVRETNEDGSTRLLVGEAKANPIVGRIEKLAFQVARFLAEFGLTPISAAKVAGEQAVEDDDPLDQILKGQFSKPDAA